MEKHLPILFIVGVILFTLGGYNFLNPSEYVWQEKKADLNKIDIETKNIGGLKKSRVVMSYQYKVGSITYQGVRIDDWKLLNKQDSDNLNKEKTIIIYHNHKNPNISFINKPKEGVYRMSIGLILIILGALFYFSSNNVQSNNDQSNHEQSNNVQSNNMQSNNMQSNHEQSNPIILNNQSSDLVSSELPLL